MVRGVGDTFMIFVVIPRNEHFSAVIDSKHPDHD